MSFAALKLKPESGANRIKTADDAYSFVAHLRLSHQNKSLWQVVAADAWPKNRRKVEMPASSRALSICESWHDPSCGTLATCRLLPNLTPSRCGGVFSFAEIGLLRVSGSWRGIDDARLEMKEAAN